MEIAREGEENPARGAEAGIHARGGGVIVVINRRQSDEIGVGGDGVGAGETDARDVVCIHDIRVVMEVLFRIVPDDEALVFGEGGRVADVAEVEVAVGVGLELVGVGEVDDRDVGDVGAVGAGEGFVLFVGVGFGEGGVAEGLEVWRVRGRLLVAIVDVGEGVPCLVGGLAGFESRG